MDGRIGAFIVKGNAFLTGNFCEFVLATIVSLRIIYNLF